MSCFVVENKTIDRILSYMYRSFDESQIQSFIGSVWGKDDKDIYLEKLGIKLLKANHKAFKIRYEDRFKEDLKDIKYRFNLIDVSPFQALMSAKCLKYQLSEGDMPNKKIYKEVERIIAIITNNIINNIPEYKACEWG